MRDPLGQLRLRYAGLGLVRAGADAEVYFGRDYRGNDVAVLVLTEVAAADPERRRAFATAVAAGATGRSGIVGSDPAADRPWVAVEGRPEAADLGQFLAGLAAGPSNPAAADSADSGGEGEERELGGLPGLGAGESVRLPRPPPTGGRIPTEPRTVAPTDRVPPPPGPVATPTRVPPPPATPPRPDRSPPARPAVPIGAAGPAVPPGSLRPRPATAASGTSSGATVVVVVVVTFVVLLGMCCVAALLA